MPKRKRSSTAEKEVGQRRRLTPIKIATLFSRLRAWATSLGHVPIVDLMSAQGDAPWQILVATMLSSRTKDETTAAAVRRLFAVADDPIKTLTVPTKRLEKLIFPVGFYQVKAARLHDLARLIIERHGGQVPRTFGELIALPGIGVKTATLVQIRAFGIAEICVDTHVHRITNLLGIVHTRRPEETREALKQVVPKRYWRSVNQYLVTLGQIICKPKKHYCDRCPISDLCPAAFEPHYSKCACTSLRMKG